MPLLAGGSLLGGKGGAEIFAIDTSCLLCTYTLHACICRCRCLCVRVHVRDVYLCANVCGLVWMNGWPKDETKRTHSPKL